MVRFEQACDFNALRGMVFMRFNADHHGVGLVGAMSDSA
jgi:hypothetical protein